MLKFLEAKYNSGQVCYDSSYYKNFLPLKDFFITNI